MATEAKRLLSGSTNGRQILVAATATPGTTIHTTLADKSQMDEIWLYAHNTHVTDDVTLTIEWGGTTSPNDHIKTTISPNVGLVQIVPGLILTNGVVVKAYASILNTVVVSGLICRVKQSNIL